jgi:GNAT superfamily N-acetyltransferase
MTVEIRKALSNKEDIEILTSLRMQMRAEREEVAAPEDLEKFREQIREYFESSLAKGSFTSFLLFEDGKIAACSGLCIERHPPTYSDPAGYFGYITNMFTVKEFRGRGFAKLLLDEIRKEAISCRCGKLMLNASSMGKPLYEKYGFKEVANEMVLFL